jgi:hypothetical protein
VVSLNQLSTLDGLIRKRPRSHVTVIRSHTLRPLNDSLVQCSGALYACLYLFLFIAAEPSLPRASLRNHLVGMDGEHCRPLHSCCLTVESLRHSLFVREERFLVE